MRFSFPNICLDTFSLIRSSPDIKNVPTKPGAARVIFLALVNFWYEHTRLLSRMTKILSSVLYQAVGGKIILGWVSFLGYVTLPSQGNFTHCPCFQKSVV